jgi:hypothetical protein
VRLTVAQEAIAVTVPSNGQAVITWGRQ